MGRPGAPAGSAAPTPPARRPPPRTLAGDLARLRRRLSAGSQGPLALGRRDRLPPPGRPCVRDPRARRRAVRAGRGGCPSAGHRAAHARRCGRSAGRAVGSDSAHRRPRRRRPRPPARARRARLLPDGRRRRLRSAGRRPPWPPSRRTTRSSRTGSPDRPPPPSSARSSPGRRGSPPTRLWPGWVPRRRRAASGRSLRRSTVPRSTRPSRRSAPCRRAGAPPSSSCSATLPRTPTSTTAAGRSRSSGC